MSNKTNGLFVKISADISKLKEELEKGKKETEKFTKSAEDHFKDFEESVNTANDVTSKAMASIGVAIAGAVTALLALSASTKEYRENQAKLTTAFETAGASAETAKQTYNDLYRVLGDDDTATEAAGHLAQLTTDQKSLSEWTTICQGVYATFGDSLPIEGLTEAANETAKVGQVTGTLADALNWAGISEDDFNAKLEKCNSEAEREKLIRETLSGVYNDAAMAYEKNASEVLAQNEAQAELAETTARLGEAVAPVMTLLTKLGTEVLAKITPYIEQFTNQYGDELEETLGKIADIVGSILEFIVSNWEIIIGLAGAIAAISAAVAIVNTALTIYSTVQALANSQMLVAIAVIAAIIAIIAILVICWDDIKNACEVAAEAIKNGWNSMGEWFKGIADKIQNAFSNMGSWFTDKFDDAKTGVQNAWKSMGTWFGNIKTNITNTFNNIGSWFGTKFGDAVSRIKNAFSAIPNFFRDIYNRLQTIFTDIGTKISNGLTEGVKNAVNAIVSKAVDVINAAIAGINGAIEFINMIPGVNVGRISEMSAPKLAKGGIIDSATLAVVGESGREAVVPLENNLGWLDKLASMLNERTGGGSNTPIILTIDGKVLGEATIKNINGITKQTGKLQLII